MSLNVDWAQTEAFKNRETDETFDKWSTWISFQTMNVGMNTITADNADEFIMRTRLIWAIEPTHLQPQEQTEMPGMVRKFVGLSSNATNLTTPQFFRQLRKAYDDML